MKKIICAVLTLILCFTSVYADGDAIKKAMANTAEMYKDEIEAAVTDCGLDRNAIDFDNISIALYGFWEEPFNLPQQEKTQFYIYFSLLDSDKKINVVHYSDSSGKYVYEVMSDNIRNGIYGVNKSLTDGTLEKMISDNNLPAPDMVRNMNIMSSAVNFWTYYINCGSKKYLIPYDLTEAQYTEYNVTDDEKFAFEFGKAYDYDSFLEMLKQEREARQQYYLNERNNRISVSSDPETGDTIYYVYGTKMTEDEYAEYLEKQNGEGEIKTDPKFTEPEEKPKTDVKQPDTEVKKPDTEVKQPETVVKPNETNKTDEKPETALTDVQIADALKEKQLFKGTENGYELDKPLTRAEGTAMLVRLIGKEADAMNASYSDEFTDVSENDWFAKYVAFAKNNKIVAGTGDGNFTPERNMTAAEFTALVLRAFGYAEAQPENAFETAKKAGLMSDAYAEKIQKLQTFLRGDMVSIAYAAAKKYNL